MDFTSYFHEYGTKKEIGLGGDFNTRSGATKTSRKFFMIGLGNDI